MCMCVDCVSRVSVSSVLLAVEILRKDDITSRAYVVKDHFDQSSCFSVWWGKICPWKTFLGVHKTL